MNKEKRAQMLIFVGVLILSIVIFRMAYSLLSPVSVSEILPTDTSLRLEQFFGNFATLFSFTNYSNIFLGLAILILGLNWKKPAKWHFDFLFFATVIITITFAIFWGVISWSQRAKWTTHPFEMILSLLVHALTPILGFVTLWVLKDKVTITLKVVLASSLYLFAYFTIAMVIYFITKATTTSQLPVVFYRFLNFEKPLFYKGGKLAVIIIMNILMLIIGAAIPLGITFFWKAVYKIKMEKLSFKKAK